MNYRINQGTLFEDFETLGDWTVGGSGNPVLTSDPVNFKTGTKSLKLTTGTALSCSALKTISLDASRSGVWGYWVNILDVTQVESVKIELSSDSSFTNRFVRTVSSAYLHNGWNFLTLDRSAISTENNWGPSGSPDWGLTQIRLRFTLTANASSTAVASFDSLYYGIYARPKIVVMFDDGWTAAYTEGYTYMRTYGLKGSVPVNSELVGDATHATLAQLQEMYAYGWDMLNHTTDHTTLSTLSAETDMLAKILPVQTYLKNNGMTRNDGYKHFVYRSGGYNDTVLQAVVDSGSLTGASIISRVEGHYAGIDSQYLIPRRTLGGSSLSAAAAKLYIDTAIANGGTYFIYLHKLVSGTEANTNEWQISKWQPWVDYLASKHYGGQLDVVTFTEWYRGLSSPRKVI